MTPQPHRQALPKGHMLQEYQLGRVLGHGGFGLTYLGWDTALDKPVAIKEYLPNDLAVREADNSVAAKSGGDEDNFKWGLARFWDEAQTLAKFKHPNIVQVHRCFEAHGTAYIVMEFVEGETLNDYLKRAGKPKEAFLRGVITALLDGLAEVHRVGFMHRDIKPGNIILNTEGTPVLVDFGSARQEVGGRSRSITSVVTPGYAPIEQYSSRGNQGQWTDIYALGAVAYRAITGAPPPDATERVLDDSIKPAVDAGRDKYSANFLRAIDAALAVNSKDRLQSVEAWRKAFASDSPTDKPATPTDAILPENDLPLNYAKRAQKPTAAELPAKREVEGMRAYAWVWTLVVVSGVGLPLGMGIDSNSSLALVVGAAGVLLFVLALLWPDSLRRKERYKDGAVGIGRYTYGARHGLWEFKWPDGRVHTGTYANGKPHGHWVLRFADGDVEEGPVVNGKRHGHWVLRVANGNVYEGPYVDGERHGHWVLRPADGGVQEGSMVNGERHGQ